MTNWQKLCKLVRPDIKEDVREDLFQAHFESYLETIFDWDKASIQHKVPVRMGRDTKEADIVLGGNDFGIVVEMKRPSIELGEEQKGQLTSYMRCLGKKYGLLIGNKIKIFYDIDLNNQKTLFEIASIDFKDDDNPDGEGLGEILDKARCSNTSLKAYAEKRLETKKTKEESELLLNELTAENGKSIKEIVKRELISNGRKEEIVLTVLKNISIRAFVPEPDYNNNRIGSSTQPLIRNQGNGSIFEKVIAYHNEVNKELPATGKAQKYRRVNINGWPPINQLHYEYLMKNDYLNIGVELHVETDQLTYLREILGQFNSSKINGFTIKFDPKWSKGCRLLIEIPFSAGVETIVSTMKEFFDLTKDTITKNIR